MKDSSHISDVTLISCPPKAVHYPPPDTAFLVSILQKKGIKVSFFDANLALLQQTKIEERKFWHKINYFNWHERLRQDGPVLRFNQYIPNLSTQILKRTSGAICLDFDYPNEIFVSSLVSYLKNKSINLSIFAYGKSCHSAEQRAFLQKETGNLIDFFVPSPVESNLPSLLDKLGKQSYVQDLEYEENLKDIFESERNTIMEYGFPSYEGVRLKDYRNYLAMNLGVESYEKTMYYGDIINCSTYYEKSLRMLIAELGYYIAHLKISKFYFHGIPVNNHSGLEEFCDYILRHFPYIKWVAKVAPWKSIPIELLKKMKSAGCHTLNFCGISGSEKILSEYFSGAKLSTIKSNLKKTTDAQIRTSVELMVGFPNENFNEFTESLNFLKENLSNIEHLYSVTPVALSPETSLFQEAKEREIIVDCPIKINEWSTQKGNTFTLRKNRLKQLVRVAMHPDQELGNTLLPHPWDISIFGSLRLRLVNPLHFHLKNEPWHPFLYKLSRQNAFYYLHRKCFIPVSEIEDGDLPVLSGAESGRQAMVGPEIVHLDLTNRCNMNCIACWDRSPLVCKSKDDPYLNKYLKYEIVVKLIDDLVSLGGLKSIKLTGGGEPTMHRRFMDILKYIRSSSRTIEIDLNTNGSLITEQLIDFMIDSEINLITISLWAATEKTYRITHPNQGENSFSKIIHNLKKISTKRNDGLPRIFIHNVIMNCNYHELDEMLLLALDIGADEVHFTLVDPVPGNTESLLLSEEEHFSLSCICSVIRKSINSYNDYEEPSTGRIIKITNFHEFCDKLMEADVEEGVYDRKALNAIPCYIGWLYTRILADGRVVPCCKGHRLPMGNLYKNDFKEIWDSRTYRKFRHNGKYLDKSEPYFSVMSNENSEVPGCANCDNIMHNTVMHDKYLFYTNLLRWVPFKLSQRMLVITPNCIKHGHMKMAFKKITSKLWKT